jgi:hypothetical protein
MRSFPEFLGLLNPREFPHKDHQRNYFKVTGTSLQQRLKFRAFTESGGMIAVETDTGSHEIDYVRP